MAGQKINTYAWARILDDASPVAAMDDAEFAEFWAGLGQVVRIACLAGRRQDGQRQPEPPIVISGQDWAVTSTLSRDEVIDRLAQAGILLVRVKTGCVDPWPVSDEAPAPRET